MLPNFEQAIQAAINLQKLHDSAQTDMFDKESIKHLLDQFCKQASELERNMKDQAESDRAQEAIMRAERARLEKESDDRIKNGGYIDEDILTNMKLASKSATNKKGYTFLMTKCARAYAQRHQIDFYKALREFNETVSSERLEQLGRKFLEIQNGKA